MTNQLKTVDEIMQIVCRYGDNCLFRIPHGNALAEIRTTITDLHSRVSELEAALRPFAQMGPYGITDVDFETLREVMGLEG